MANDTPAVAMTYSTTDSSQPSGAQSPQSATRKDIGYFKVTSKDKLSRWGSAWMFMAVTLVAGDFLLLQYNGATQINLPWNAGWKGMLSWVWSEMWTLDCVLFGAFAIVFAYFMLRPSGSPNDSDTGRAYAYQYAGGKPQATGARKRKAAVGTMGNRHSGGGESSVGVPSQRDAGASVPERTMAAERSNVVLAKWNQAIDFAARQGDADKAAEMLMEFERLGELAGHRPDAVNFNQVIRAYAKKGNVQGAERWLARMEERGIQPTVCSYNTVLDACAKSDDAQACESWLQRMLDKKVEPNVISYSTAIYARARHGDEAHAERWLQQMIKDEIEPDAVSYNSMIHACGVAGNPEGAERWIQEMQARGLEATVTTYTAVIDACAKSGDVPRAEKWLESMITAQVQPNVVSFSAMIDACAKACDPARAEFWHNRMVDCHVRPNAHSFSAVINACAKAGEAAMAEKWLEKSEQAGVAKDVVVYSSVIDACGKVGDAERAMAVFQRMQANGIRPHIVAYAALARTYAHRGDYPAVEGIAKEMKESGVILNEYFLYAQLLAYATARPRQALRAESCFRCALKSGVKVNDQVVGVLARAVGRQRCTELMADLCNGRPVPNPPQRREGGGGNMGPRARKCWPS
mmetsp:Transcript_119488/g.223365  ORF Transcript_119488/g.223365 Transcript_119488/m.223365 type:complete len:635 (+) Transcript_119488:144-2048(+)